MNNKRIFSHTETSRNKEWKYAQKSDIFITLMKFYGTNKDEKAISLVTSILLQTHLKLLKG